MEQGLRKRSARQRQRYHESSDEDTEVAPQYRESNKKLIKAEALEEQEAMHENYSEEGEISEYSSEVENFHRKKKIKSKKRMQIRKRNDKKTGPLTEG